MKQLKMKMKGVLILSLGLNATLLAGFWKATRPTPTPVERPLAEPSLASRLASAREQAGKGEVPVESHSSMPFSWSDLESQDYHVYINNLRSVGCPEETVRDIIITDVSKVFAQRRAGLLTQLSGQFWLTDGAQARELRRKREEALEALDKEKKDLLRELLGIDLDRELARWEGPDEGEIQRYGFLSPEKQAQLKELEGRYRQMERDLVGDNGRGNWTPEMRAQFEKLRADRSAEMAQLLSPTEYEEYQLRNSPTGRRMREDLASFAPSEQEFREIFRLKQTFDEQYASRRGEEDPAFQQQRQAAEEQMEAQLKAMLGEDRYQEYQLARDDRYRQSYEFAQRYELPKETAYEIYDMRRVAEDEMRRVMRDQSLVDEQRQAILTLLADETRKTFTATLGDNFENYMRRGGGNWINGLANGGRERGGDRRGRGGPPR